MPLSVIRKDHGQKNRNKKHEVYWKDNDQKKQVNDIYRVAHSVYLSPKINVHLSFWLVSL